MNEHYYAHTNEQRKQSLRDHLFGTAEIAQSKALPQLAYSAFFCGILHDVGKYQQEFQERLNGKNIIVEHSGCGAIEANRFFNGNFVGKLFAYIIAGHHSGLPNYGTEQSDKDEPVLCSRLKRVFSDYSVYKNEINVESYIPNVTSEIKHFFENVRESQLADKFEFLVRYLYSCLVDADFLDTENFCVGQRRKLPCPDWMACCLQIDAQLHSFSAVTTLQRSREVLQKTAFENIKKTGPIYLLNMPTGSGKTLCSVRLALERLRLSEKKRIIYVIPYTSIIEQTAETLEKVFPNLAILQHHSDFDFEEDSQSFNKQKDNLHEEKITGDVFRFAAENWDAPMVVTTNVQFFESIYGNKSSKLRKFHNMSNCVFVFDEIHTLPAEFFVPCMKAIDELTCDYGSEAIFLTATMPDFADLAYKYLNKKIGMCDLVPYCKEFSAFEKCNYIYIDEKNILEHYKKNEDGKSALFIFNKKKSVKEYYDLYIGKKKYCLSTYITPLDRSRLISSIREDLKNGEAIVVFATSLIEAGVDLDFDCVYREIAGIDNILQAGGRCNREGIKQKQDSNVYIFSFGDLRGEIQVKADITKGLLREFGAANISCNECIKKYYDEIYRYYERIFIEKGKYIGFHNFYKISFADKAEKFKLIDSDSLTVIIPHVDIAKEIEQLRMGGFISKRKLQKYGASVNKYELEELLQIGAVKEESGFFVLQSLKYYSPESGIKTESDKDYFY